MMCEVFECFKLLNDYDHDHLVVVLTGNGKHFSVGVDLKTAPEILFNSEKDNARNSIQLKQVINNFQESFAMIGKCRLPVLTGIHKTCIGGAVDLIAYSDIRYCTEDANFSIKEVDLAIVPYAGTPQNLPWKTANNSTLRELVYTGRFFSGKEALELGLVGKVFKNKEEMMKGLLDTAALIAKKSLVAIYGIKQVFIKQNQQRVDESSEYLSLLNSALMRTEDLPKSMEAFFMKKDPAYSLLAQRDKTKEAMEKAKSILYKENSDKKEVGDKEKT